MQVVLPLQLLLPCPNFWELKQRKGFGIYSSTFVGMYSAKMYLGGVGVLKVRITVLVFLRLLLSFTIMTVASVAP